MKQEIVKELFTPSKEYKAEIIKRNDGLFEYRVYHWTREEVPEYGYTSEWYWDPITTTLSLTDTKANAVKLALQELHQHSGEEIE